MKEENATPSKIRKKRACFKRITQKRGNEITARNKIKLHKVDNS